MLANLRTARRAVSRMRADCRSRRDPMPDRIITLFILAREAAEGCLHRTQKENAPNCKLRRGCAQINDLLIEIF